MHDEKPPQAIHGVFQNAPGDPVVRPGGKNVNRRPVAQILSERVVRPGERAVAASLEFPLAVNASADDGGTYALFLAKEAQMEVESCLGIGNMVSDAGVFLWMSDVEWMQGDERRGTTEDVILTAGDIASAQVWGR